MPQACTLHEIALKYANKQPEMVDSLTEAAPILQHMKWKPATHGDWHNAEKLTDITGPGWIEPDAPIPLMHTSSDIITTNLGMMAGSMEVPSERALKFGGAAKYFADRQNIILKKAGMDTEKTIVLDYWLAAAAKNKNICDAGGTDPEKDGFLLAVRMDQATNIGLFNPDQFEKGRFFKITFPYDGAEYHLKAPGYSNVLGYGITYRTKFGWMCLDGKRTCSAIINVGKDNCPTPYMIDDMLSDVRAQPGNTFIFCGPRAKTYGINPHKREVVQMTNTEKNVQTVVDHWNGIPIIPSYNFDGPMPKVKI